MEKQLDNISFTAMFNAMVDAMLLVDDRGKVVLANDSAIEMLAYRPDELVGLKVESLMPSAYREMHIQYRQDFIKQKSKRVMNGKQFFALTKAGKKIPVEIGLTPIKMTEKNYSLVVFHSINKQIAIEASLKMSEEQFRLAKTSAGLGVFDIDLVSHAVQYDALVGQMFGFHQNETITYQQVIEAIDIADQASWKVVVDNGIQPASDTDYELEFRVNNDLDKMQHWLHMAGKVFFNDSVAVRMLGIVQDVTERKSLQQKISKQRIELETLANTQVAIQTASAIAHEINQPLAAISAYSEVALYALKAEKIDADRLNRSLSGCVMQAQRAGKSLHELMEFLHKGEIETGPVDVNEVVHEALKITHHNDYGGFKSTLDLEPELPKVRTNRTQLQKVLINILRNGVEAVHNIGVPIANIQVKVRTHADLNMAEVIIQDNGPGLTPEVSERIFEPFFTTKPDGIGMGLAISRSLIEACGGQLWFDVDSNEGAIFHLTLPFVKN